MEKPAPPEAARTNPGVQTARQLAKRWYIGAMNDGRFIIDTPPRPSTDETWHERPDGPGLVLNVVALSQEEAEAIVDAHNAAIDERDGAVLFWQEATEADRAARDRQHEAALDEKHAKLVEVADKLATTYATTDGIATGLRRALVALEQRAIFLSSSVTPRPMVTVNETNACVQVIRSLLFLEGRKS